MLSRTQWMVLVAGTLFSPVAPAMQTTEPPKDWEEGVLGDAVPLVLEEANLEFFNDGPAVQSNLILRFKNPSRRITEGVCYIPVSDRVVERDFTVDNDGVFMQGHVRQRDRVIRVYRDITRPPPRRQKDPAVLERIDENWLRATISPIPAGADVEIQLSAVGLLESFGTGRRFEHLMPTIRSQQGGMIPYRMEGVLAETEAMRIHAPEQRLEHFSPTDFGYEFRVQGPTGHDGVASLFFDNGQMREPLTTRCYRQQNDDGFFVTELDPSFLLAEPLAAASYVLVLDLPETTSGATWRASQEMLDGLLHRLSPQDRIAVISSNAKVSIGARSKQAKPQAVELARQAITQSRGKGSTELSSLLEPAFAVQQTSDLPVRILLISGSREFPNPDVVLADLCRFLQEAPQGSALFTMGLGKRTDHATLARLAKWGRGRGFAAHSESHLVGIASCLVDALRHPILERPQLAIAGSSEVNADQVRSLTYGDTLFVSGRYHSGGPTLVQLSGQIGDRAINEMLATHFTEECHEAPWVATLWAKRRVEHLEQEHQQRPAADMQYFATRLAERFGLITENTVSLALEPSLQSRLPQLVGPNRNQNVVAAVIPFVPLTTLQDPEAVSARDERAERNLLNLIRTTVDRNSDILARTRATSTARPAAPTSTRAPARATRGTATRASGRGL